MCQFLKDNWKELMGFAIAGFGIYKYFATRRTELAWRRTEFIFDQARRLEDDQDLSETIAILEGRCQDNSIEKIIGESQNEYLQKLDKLLNLFDRLAYATLHQKTIDKKEVANFGWYLQKICENDKLVQYCENHGFRDIIKLGKELNT